MRFPSMGMFCFYWKNYISRRILFKIKQLNSKFTFQLVILTLENNTWTVFKKKFQNQNFDTKFHEHKLSNLKITKVYKLQI